MSAPDFDVRQPHAAWATWLRPAISEGSSPTDRWKAIDSIATKWASIKAPHREYARDQIAFTNLAVNEYIAGLMAGLQEQQAQLHAQQERTNELLELLVAQQGQTNALLRALIGHDASEVPS